MEILTFTKLEAQTNPCSNFSINITTDTDVDIVVVADGTNSSQLIGDEQILPNRRDFTITIPRNRIFSSIRVFNNTVNENDVEFTQFIPFWEIQPVLQFPSPVASTTSVRANVFVDGDQNGSLQNALELEFSIDGVNYQSSANFLGLNLNQNYTMYIRDGFGCEKEIEFTTNPLIQSVDPYFFVSMLNPIYFAQRNTLRKNPLNQLSYEFVDDTNFKDFKYILNSNNTYQFQFRSSYNRNKAILVNCNGETTELPLFKKSNNIARQDFRDCVLLPNNENNFIELKYEGGNIYDSDFNITGESTLFNTLLVENRVGTFITLYEETTNNFIGTFEILDIIEDETGSKLVLNWDAELAEAETAIASIYYNANNYEVYEFILPIGLVDDRYQIALFGDNSAIDINEKTALRSLSEQFEMTTENLDNYHRLTWKNDENNQITWETGIECTTYLPKNENPTFSPESEDEVFMTDIAPRLLEANVNEIYTFYLGLVPLAVARQIQYIVSNDYLLIDGVFYTKQETPEVEAANGSNNYIVQVPLMLADTFNTNERKGISDIDTNTAGYVELDDNGYLNL